MTYTTSNSQLPKIENLKFTACYLDCQHPERIKQGYNAFMDYFTTLENFCIERTRADGIKLMKKMKTRLIDSFGDRYRMLDFHRTVDSEKLWINVEVAAYNRRI